MKCIKFTLKIALQPQERGGFAASSPELCSPRVVFADWVWIAANDGK